MNADKLKQVCKIGQAKDCCRYLACGGSGFSCLKLDPSAKEHLDFRVEMNMITAQGDNCDGDTP